MSSSQKRQQLMEQVGYQVMAMQEATDQVDEAAANLWGLNRSDMRGIGALDRLGPLGAGDLAAATGLTTGAVTTMVDRLEGSGFVRRVADPDDRRRVVVELTNMARQKSAELYGPMAAAGQKMMSGYSDEQLEFMLGVLKMSTDIQLEQAAKIRAMAPRGANRRAAELALKLAKLAAGKAAREAARGIAQAALDGAAAGAAAVLEGEGDKRGKRATRGR